MASKSWLISESKPTGTFYAPAELAAPACVRALAESLGKDPLLDAFFNSVPGYAVVLNPQRQIVYANDRFLQGLGIPDLRPLIGQRVGAAFRCVHVQESPGGCGTAEACTTCGAGTAVHESQKLKTRLSRECRISVQDDAGGALDFEAIAAPFSFQGEALTILTLRDVSGELRRRVLERVFFHDVLNTAGGLQGLSRLLWEESGEGVPSDDEESWIRKSVYELSNQLVSDIQSQRALAAAEAGELQVEAMVIDAAELVESSISVVSGHESCEGRTIRFENRSPIRLVSDPHLLHRVLVNLLKNAVEATPAGGVVTVDAELGEEETVLFTVHNPTVMPQVVQLQIFQRSFSTKDGQGRGIGTYSVKLLGEKYLGGRVSFTSGEPHGTLFRFILPIDRRAQP